MKRGHRFGVRRGADWGVVGIQKHGLATTAEQVQFTIEVGAWFRNFEDEPRESPPAISACHWSQRVGGEPPEADERWWIIDRETELDRLTSVLTPAVEAALASLARCMDERFVIAQYLAGNKFNLRIGKSYRDRILRLAARL